MSLVSIILPNLNTPLQFLKERVQSIIDQTHTSWECIIVDGYSDNGSWEYLQEIASKDSRFKSYQFQKEGIYKAWNSGIHLAVGDYIYIATSDDLMTVDCIEKLLAALKENPECEISHCCLTLIDEYSNVSVNKQWKNFPAGKFFGDYYQKRHIRFAPYDGILHCSLKTVYTSSVQLLIKKSVFDKVGYFLTDGGSIADFEWGMRASLVVNTVHVPEYLASWRIHSGQATTNSIQTDPNTYRCLRKFMDHAFGIVISKGLLDKKFYQSDLKDVYWATEWKMRKLYTSRGAQVQWFASFLLNKPLLALKILLRKSPDTYRFIVSKIRELELENNLKIIG